MRTDRMRLMNCTSFAARITANALLDYKSLGLTPDAFPQVRAEYLEYHNSLVREAQA
jgi:hypothetical protein